MVTRVLAGIGAVVACTGFCGAAPGEEGGTGFAYVGRWPAPPVEKAASSYDWRSWSGPRSSYGIPVDDPARSYDDEFGYARIRVDRRIHDPDSVASSGRIGLTLWARALHGTHKFHTGAVFGGLFLFPSRSWPNEDNRWRSIVHVPVDFYGGFDFSPKLVGGYDGADAPFAHVVSVTATPRVRDGDQLRQLRAIASDRPDPAYLVLASIDPTRENVAGAVETLERALAAQREKGGGKEGLLNLGWFHHRFTRDRAKALWCFERVYRDLDPVPGLQGAAAYYYGLGLEDAGRAAEAKQVYQGLVRTYPEDFWTTDAIERLEKLGISKSSLRLGLPPAGEAATRRYLRAFSAGEYAAALRQARAVSAAFPGDPWSRLYEAYLLRLLPDQQRADRSLAALQRQWPPYAAALDLLCVVFGSIDQEEITAAGRLRPHRLRGASEPLPFLLARVRDRTQRFADDPLVWILRAQSRYLMEYPLMDARPIGLDALAEYRRAVALAPRSWAVRMYGLNLANIDIPQQGRQLPLEEVAETAETVLRLNEKETWGLHHWLAEGLYAPEVLNQPQRREEHRRRYEALKKRYGGGDGH